MPEPHDEAAQPPTSGREQRMRQQRAAGIVALGLVSRDGDRFLVQMPFIRERRPCYEVWRDDRGEVRCNCEEFIKGVTKIPRYRCLHILAVKHAVETSRVRPSTERILFVPQRFTAGGGPTNHQRTTTARRALLRHARMSGRGGPPAAEGSTGVKNLTWQKVTDALDRLAPTWSYRVRFVTTREDGSLSVTVSITIDNITHEATGLSASRTEHGLRRAEHDALKMAAVRFPRIAGAVADTPPDPGEMGPAPPIKFRGSPEARSLRTLITPAQRDNIQKLARDLGSDPDRMCRNVFRCRTEELSKRAASILITFLEGLLRQQTNRATRALAS